MKMLFAILTVMLFINTEQSDNIAKVYTLCIENNRENSELYKSHKILKGAGICDDIALGEIDNFENITSVTNDIYIRKLKYEEVFPMEWVIDLYSKNKIPLIVLPCDIQKEEVEEYAEICRNLDKPIFIEIDCGYNVEKYAEISQIPKETAPNIAVVWNIDSNCADVDGIIYPKDLPVDWIGVDIKSKCIKGGIESQIPNVISICRYFSEKPIMLNISVSHFSNADNKYYLEDAVNEMTGLYDILSDFRGVSAVNYISFSELKGAEDCKNNYKLSDNTLLMDNYKYCTDLLNVEKYFSQTGEVAYLINEKAYVNTDTAMKLNIKTKASEYQNLKMIDDFCLDNSGLKIFVKSKKM